MFKVGIIGLGYIGATHAQVFSDIDGVEVAAIADLSDACIQACAAKHDIEQTFSDYRELLALADLDLVVVCLPNNLHAQVSIEALNLGHNVLCEKPMATTVKDAEAMIAAAEAKQRMLAIVLNFRWQYFGPDAFHLKKLIADGELGEIYYLRVQYLRRTSFPFGGYERWNLKQKESGGGVLIDLGPHMLDLAMWLLDDYSARSVNGITHHGLIKGSQVDDFSSGAVTMADSTRIQMDLAWNSHNEPSWKISVYGDKGGAVLDADQPALHRIKRYGVDDNEPVSRTVTSDEIDKPLEASVQEHVVKRMLAGEVPDCTAEKSLQVMKVIEGWYQSNASGRDVML